MYDLNLLRNLAIANIRVLSKDFHIRNIINVSYKKLAKCT
jgi:hypothetical protein